MTESVAISAMDLLHVDPSGFDAMDRRLLQTIIEKFDGGPVGIESLSAALGEERGTIEDVIEPYLIQQGFVMRTARGRVATRNAYLHFGLTAAQHAKRCPSCRCSTGTDETGKNPVQASGSKQPFAWPVRVYFEDTDAQGRRLLRQLLQIHGARTHGMVALRWVSNRMCC